MTYDRVDPEVFDAVLDRPHLVDVRDVARDADDEQVADAGVEHELDRHAAVGAREDGRDGMLRIGVGVTPAVLVPGEDGPFAR
jgi:hypothetical protein